MIFLVLGSLPRWMVTNRHVWRFMYRLIIRTAQILWHIPTFQRNTKPSFLSLLLLVVATASLFRLLHVIVWMIPLKNSLQYNLFSDTFPAATAELVEFLPDCVLQALPLVHCLPS